MYIFVLFNMVFRPNFYSLIFITFSKHVKDISVKFHVSSNTLEVIIFYFFNERLFRGNLKAQKKGHSSFWQRTCMKQSSKRIS